MKEPYNWDEYAKMYFPKAKELANIAEEAEQAGEKEKASEYYLYELAVRRLRQNRLTVARRSSAVYRIARFPAPRSDQQRYAWKEGKKVFYKGAG